MSGMLLNGKTIEEWTELELLLLINNSDLKESETIDYKTCFAFLESTDRQTVQHKKDEFRHDVCSFANANGGVMLFGVTEENGVATSLNGISIKNNDTDSFECRLKDIISKIKPIVPPYTIFFVKLNNDNFITIIQVEEGIYKPYVYLENDEFKFVMRRGNGKVCLNYEEVKLMFNQSLELSKQIDSFINGRIEKCLDKEGVASSATIPSFALMHFIPKSAFTSRYVSASYISNIQNRLKYNAFFSRYGNPIPNVDGIVYIYNYNVGKELKYLQLFKNGIVEKYITLPPIESLEYTNVRIPVATLCDEVRSVYNEVNRYYTDLHINEPYYVCISVLNCKGYCTEFDFTKDYEGIIDRNEVICMPIEIIQTKNQGYLQKMISDVLNDLCHSIGIINVKELFTSIGLAG
jgi:hypothetical protein